MRVAALVLLALPLVAAADAVLVGTQRAPIDPATVVVYSTPPPAFERIALVEATSKLSFRLGDQGKADKVIERLKEQAAALGANGLLIESLGDAADAAPAPSATAPLNSATRDPSGRTSVASSGKKVGKGVAIYVPPAAAPVAAPADPGRAEIGALLDQLYRTFNYGPGREPDWQAMRALFIDGAQFVPEPAAGQPLRSYDVDAVIAKWQASMRKAGAPNPGYSEWIDGTTITRTGDLVRVDVTFYGKAPGDAQPRQPGLDSLILVRQDGAWKVLSFVVQRESKP